MCLLITLQPAPLWIYPQSKPVNSTPRRSRKRGPATHDCTLWRCSERSRRRRPPSPALWPWPQYVRTTTQNSGLGSRPVRPVRVLYTA